MGAGISALFYSYTAFFSIDCFSGYSKPSVNCMSTESLGFPQRHALQLPLSSSLLVAKQLMGLCTNSGHATSIAFSVEATA